MDSFEKDVTDKFGDINLSEPVKEISVTISLIFIQYSLIFFLIAIICNLGKMEVSASLFKSKRAH